MQVNIPYIWEDPPVRFPFRPSLSGLCGGLAILGATNHAWKLSGRKKVTRVPSGKRSHSNGKSPFSIGNTSSKGPFSIAMLVYRCLKHADFFVFFT